MKAFIEDYKLWNVLWDKCFLSTSFFKLLWNKEILSKNIRNFELKYKLNTCYLNEGKEIHEVYQKKNCVLFNLICLKSKISVQK
jgi:hypothetical protein